MELVNYMELERCREIMVLLEYWVGGFKGEGEKSHSLGNGQNILHHKNVFTTKMLCTVRVIAPNNVCNAMLFQAQYLLHLKRLLHRKFFLHRRFFCPAKLLCASSVELLPWWHKKFLRAYGAWILLHRYTLTKNQGCLFKAFLSLNSSFKYSITACIQFSFLFLLHFVYIVRRR